MPISSKSVSFDSSPPIEYIYSPATQAYAGQKKKYKPVAKKVRPIKTELPKHFRIERNIIGDPLSIMPKIDIAHLCDFSPTGRYTADRMQAFQERHANFLLPEEQKLLHVFMMANNQAFAWDDSERGRFDQRFFPPVSMAVVPHIPWVEKNIPIPRGLYDEVCRIVRDKIRAGVYEPSNASYRSKWFCVLKADGKSLRPVHSLEELNRVTIQHSGVPPMPDELAETFGGRPCGAALDLFVGYDNRDLDEDSRDYTTFQSPYGLMRLTKLPMGWTNSVPIFHEDVTYILQDETPEWTIPYIDDVPVKGPASDYRTPDGDWERCPENPGIRRFVWEHFRTIARIVARMKYSGGTFSGKKSVLIAKEFYVVGNRCTPNGREPPMDRVLAISNWGPCHTLSEVRAFLGTVGVLRIFISNFGKRAWPLVRLTRKDAPFEWGVEQITAQEDLKQAVLHSPALRAIDYHTSNPVILGVDTSYIAVGFFLAQKALDHPKGRYFNRFGSITLNDRESRFSQPKLEIYGLFRSLRALKKFLLGVRNLIVEMDAKFVREMLRKPDIAPSASINRWIMAILAFHFELVHVPGAAHGADGLSRRPRQPGDPEPVDDEEEFEDWIDSFYSLPHMIMRPIVPTPSYGAIVSVLSQTTAEPRDSIPESRLPDSDLTYSDIPRKPAHKDADRKLPIIKQWFEDLKRPASMSDKEYNAFMRYATHFFPVEDRLWRKDVQGAHKKVAWPEERLEILKACHDEAGHRGVYATQSALRERFWWAGHLSDVAWYVKTCHLCQERQMRQVLIPPTVAYPAPLFARLYVDTMHLPPSGGFKYIVQARCSLVFYPEWRMLRRETAKAIGDWIWQDILCRWGAVSEIVTDNGAPFVKALDYLAQKYHIYHIRISGYNSRANGTVEVSHGDIRQSLYKAADGDASKWSQVAYSVFWSERITVRRRMGCSPYFAVTGTHPLIPLDITEATYLQPPPSSILSTTDLIARRAIALQKRSEDIQRIHSKVYEARRLAATRFETEHASVIKDFDFTRGDLVLMRNTAIEKSLNRKMRPRYLGPLIVLGRNRGGAYLLCELDGSVLDRPVAAFRVVPYFARKSIPLPDNFMDITPERLKEMAESQSQGDDDPLPDSLSDTDSDSEPDVDDVN